jgi:hypothetical protein
VNHFVNRSRPRSTIYLSVTTAFQTIIHIVNPYTLFAPQTVHFSAQELNLRFEKQKAPQAEIFRTRGTESKTNTRNLHRIFNQRPARR